MMRLWPTGRWQVLEKWKVFWYGLDGFGASAGASAMNALACPAMMRAELSARRIENRVGGLATERGLDHVGGRGHSERSVLPLEKINDRFALRGNLLAQMKQSVFPIEDPVIAHRCWVEYTPET